MDTIIDSHSHYNLEPFVDNWPLFWHQAQEHGVKQSIVVGTDFTSSAMAATIALKEPQLFAAIGLHPSNYTELLNDTPTEEMTERLHQDEWELSQIYMPGKDQKIVAIGETGLDYFRLPDSSDPRRQKIIDAQQQSFRMQLQLAKDTQLPLIIHVRDTTEQAYWDVLHILKAEKYEQPFVLHCISGPLAYLKEALDRGAYIGVAGNITYRSAEHLRDLVRATPKERVLLETDAPFLPPNQHRGKTCEPWMISLTAQFVREELQLDPAQCAANTRVCFQLEEC